MSPRDVALEPEAEQAAGPSTDESTRAPSRAAPTRAETLQTQLGNAVVARALMPSAAGDPTATLEVDGRIRVLPRDGPQEGEADRVADGVTRAPAQTMPPAVQRMAADEALEPIDREAAADDTSEEQTLAALAQPGAAPTVTPNVARDVRELTGRGQPLPFDTRAGFERRFGRDLGGVRVHTDAHAQALADAVHARAFTTGNHVTFAAGEFAPENHAGERLLAHELTHVVQQGAAPPMAATEAEESEISVLDLPGGAVLQRQPRPAPPAPKPPAPPIRVRVNPEISTTTWPDQGLMAIDILDAPWVSLRWSGGAKGTPTVMVTMTDHPAALSVEAHSSSDLRVTVARETEEAFAARQLEGCDFKHAYVGGGHRIKPNDYLPSKGGVATRKAPDDFTHYPGHAIRERPEWNPGPPPPLVKEPPPFWWQFDDDAQLDLFAAEHPRFYWVAFGPERPRKAWNLLEAGMQKVANAFREDAGYAANILKIYEHGKAWPSTDPLYHLFYESPFAAKTGVRGDAPECVVFRHDRQFFGRLSLSHEETLKLWWLLEFLDSAQQGGLHAVEEFTIDRGTFVLLVGRGLSGALYDIDFDYFKLREAFFRNVEAKKPLFGGGEDWDDLINSDKSQELYYHYLHASIDREEGAIDPQLLDVINNDNQFADVVGRKIYDRVEKSARKTATGAVETAMSGIAAFLNRDKLQRLIFTFPRLSFKDRADALAYLGVGAPLNYMWAGILGVDEMALQVAMGSDLGGISLDALSGFVNTQYSGMQDAVTQLNEQADPLANTGPFGDEVREKVYKAYGFKLDPRAYPHGDVVWQRHGLWRVGPQQPLPVGNMAGDLYARAASSIESWKTFKRYLTIALIVAAGLALLFVAAFAGAMLAGFIVGEAATGLGAFAFFLIDAGTTSLIMTFAGPALTTILTGGSWADYTNALSHWKRDLLVNMLAFGFFKVVGMGARALVMAGAGVKSAAQLSTAWKVAEIATRIGLSGASMFMMTSILYWMDHGKLPEGQSLDEIVFETCLSVTLMEVAGFLLKDSMAGARDWANRKRLGDFVGRMNDLQGSAKILALRAAEYGARPLGGAEKGYELGLQMKELLGKHKQLLEEMRAKTRTSADADAFDERVKGDLAEIDARIAIITQVETFAKAGVKPAPGTTDEVAQFTYKRGHEQEIKNYYGEENVTEVGDRLEVEFEGKKLVFRPATDVQAGILPDGTHKPATHEAWKSTAVQRQRKVLERAAARGVNNKTIRDVVDADVSSFDDEKMRTYEQKLAKAENFLDKRDAAGPAPPTSTEQAGDDTQSWRSRLAAERQRLLALAELLGLGEKSEVLRMKDLRTGGRKSLTDADLAEHRRIIEEARKVVDEAQTERMKELDAAQGPPVDVNALQEKLVARRADVLRRADRYGASGRNYIEEVRDLRIRARGPRPGKDPSESLPGLSDAETIIARAEARLDALARKAFARGVAARGADFIKRLRTLAGLEKLTDAQIGDVLDALADAGTLSEKALRGALLTLVPVKGRSAIPLENLVANSRNVPELEFMLETFATARDWGIDGAYDVMRDAAGNPDSWQGAVWQFDLAVSVFGLENVESFEFRIDTASGGREVDIKLRNGKLIECKDWGTWFPEKVDAQFFKDLEHKTASGAQPDGMKDIHWMFRHPPPVSLAEIKATMRATAERFTAEMKMSSEDARQFMHVFDTLVDDLVQVRTVDRTKTSSPRPAKPASPLPVPPPLPPPVTDDDDDKDHP